MYVGAFFIDKEVWSKCQIEILLKMLNMGENNFRWYI